MLPVPEFGGLTARATPDKPSAISRGNGIWGEHYAYKFRFGFEERYLTVDFRTGIGWTEAPSPAMVLETYFDDARSGREAGSFEEYASEFGWEWEEDLTVRRRVERSYRACLRADEQLRTLFGEHFEHAERVFTELNHPGRNSALSLAMLKAHSDGAPDSEEQRPLWRIQTVLDGFYDGTQNDADTAVRDLLTDLIHYCDTHGVDLDDELGRATSMARQESAEWHAS
jgi:hypothetical protein